MLVQQRVLLVYIKVALISTDASETRVVRISPPPRPSTVSLPFPKHRRKSAIAKFTSLTNPAGTNNLAARGRGRRHAAVRVRDGTRAHSTRRKSGHRDVSNEKALGFFRCGVYFPCTVPRAGPQHWHAVTQDWHDNQNNATFNIHFKLVILFVVLPCNRKPDC